jgi:hypothetical protein
VIFIDKNKSAGPALAGAMPFRSPQSPRLESNPALTRRRLIARCRSNHPLDVELRWRVKSRSCASLLDSAVVRGGTITQEQFQNYAFRDDNFFEQQLKAGCTIQTARLEKGGLDEDEDQLVFELEPDWGARPLRNPKP